MEFLSFQAKLQRLTFDLKSNSKNFAKQESYLLVLYEEIIMETRDHFDKNNLFLVKLYNREILKFSEDLLEIYISYKKKLLRKMKPNKDQGTADYLLYKKKYEVFKIMLENLDYVLKNLRKANKKFKRKIVEKKVSNCNTKENKLLEMWAKAKMQIEIELNKPKIISYEFDLEKHMENYTDFITKLITYICLLLNNNAKLYFMNDHKQKAMYVISKIIHIKKKCIEKRFCDYFELAIYFLNLGYTMNSIYSKFSVEALGKKKAGMKIFSLEVTVEGLKLQERLYQKKEIMEYPNSFIIFYTKKVELFLNSEFNQILIKNMNNYNFTSHVCKILQNSYHFLGSMINGSFGLVNAESIKENAFQKSAEFQEKQKNVEIFSKLTNCTKTDAMTLNQLNQFSKKEVKKNTPKNQKKIEYEEIEQALKDCNLKKSQNNENITPKKDSSQKSSIVNSIVDKEEEKGQNSQNDTKNIENTALDQNSSKKSSIVYSEFDEEEEKSQISENGGKDNENVIKDEPILPEIKKSNLSESFHMGLRQNENKLVYKSKKVINETKYAYSFYTNILYDNLVFFSLFNPSINYFKTVSFGVSDLKDYARYKGLGDFGRTEVFQKTLANLGKSVRIEWEKPWFADIAFSYDS